MAKQQRYLDDDNADVIATAERHDNTSTEGGNNA